MKEPSLFSLLEELSDQPQRLIELILQQADRIDELQEKLQKAQQRISQLQEQLEQAQREAKRPAAPFRKPEEKRSKNPKKPGRKAGHPGHYRQPPPEVDQQIEVPLSCCPLCNEDLSECLQRPLIQTIIDLPPIKPIVTELTTYQCECSGCGQLVSSQHPLKVSEATGAAGTHLGAQALGLACSLNKEFGLSMHKTCRILKAVFDLPLTPGGLSQALDRIAQRVEGNYQDLRLELLETKAVYADETSWWVGGPGYWLWVFTHAQGTFYKVVNSRGREVIHEILDKDYSGVLISDCLNIYDDATPVQHKCYSHHLKAISEALQEYGEKGEGFLQKCRAMLKAAMVLKSIQEHLGAQEYNQKGQALANTAEKLLGSARDDPLEERVRKRLFKQKDHLFTFLYHEEVDATNNLAERQLRPAVIARKLSCGNKTPSGANTWQILASLAATCRQRGQGFIDLVASAMPIIGR